MEHKKTNMQFSEAYPWKSNANAESHKTGWEVQKVPHEHQEAHLDALCVVDLRN